MNSRTFVCCLVQLTILSLLPDVTVHAQQTASFSTAESLDNMDGCVIPFQFDALLNPQIVVQVSISGKPPLPFILDTGATAPLTVFPGAAKILGLQPGVQNLKGETLGQSFSLPIAPVENARLIGVGGEGITIPVKQAAIADDSLLQANPLTSGPQTSGIIGLGMFALLGANLSGVCLDFEAKTMSVFTKTDLSQIKGNATFLPMTVSDALPLLSINVGYASGKTVGLIVDTGSDTTQLPLSTVASLNPMAEKPVCFASLAAFYLTTGMLLRDLNLGANSVPGVVINVLPEAPTYSLGLNVLSRFRVTLDFRNMQMIIQQYPKPVLSEPMPGVSGYIPNEQNNAYIVTQLFDGYPAKTAGVHVGDKILAIDGRSLHGLSGQQFEMLGAAPPGTQTTLLLERPGGKRVSVSYRLVNEFDQPKTAATGLILKRPAAAPITILAVTPGCTGDKAGLKGGDQIIKLDGKNTDSMSYDQLVASLSGDSLSLVIQHAGNQVTRTVRLITTTR